MSFQSFDLDPSILRGIEGMGFSEPTPIQAKGIPPALEGRDVLGCAMTGSGKTATFLLPILQYLAENPQGGKKRRTRALVIAPTRELAAQIVTHFQDLAKHTPYKAAAVFGGVGMGPQEKAFRRGVDLIVACPGRLLDHLQYDYANLDGVEMLVLDEVDRMLDMGFLPDIRRVLKAIPEDRQTLLFSATLPKPIAKLARELLHQPVTLDVERPAAPAHGVTQAVYSVAQNMKTALLAELLDDPDIESALVFTRTKHRADRVARFLDKNGIPAERIHGNRSQNQRNKALAGFRSGKYRVLVATDVASRGIDVEELSHVVNFDVPHPPEDYIHRVGRTARAGATGTALTFVSPDERGELRAIERAVGKSIPRRSLDGLDLENISGEPLEIPIAERIAAIRARKADDRARSRAKAERRAANEGGGREGKGSSTAGESGGGGNRRRRGRGPGQGQGAAAQGKSAQGHGSRGQGNRGQSSGSQGNRSQGNRGQGNRSQGNRGQGSGSQGNRSQGSRGAGNRRGAGGGRRNG